MLGVEFDLKIVTDSCQSLILESMPNSLVPTGQQESAYAEYFFWLWMLMSIACLKREHICIKPSLNDLT